MNPFPPKPHGEPRVDERRVLSGIIFINRNGLRWSANGIFARMVAGLAAEHGEEKAVRNYATYFKAHRSATSMGV